MDTVLLCLSIAISMTVFHFSGGYCSTKNRSIWLWLFFIIGVIALATMPFIMMKEGILSETVINVMIASLAIVYYALMVGRLVNKRQIG